MKISVVIPALNEAERIVETLASVHAQSTPFEVIVVDGGSDDATAVLAEPFARVLQSDRGRARQMNTGAASATGTVLLFLHADTHLPAGALDAVRGALENPAAVGGCFRLSFDRSSALLRLYATWTRLPWHRIAFGDRALFARRTALDEPPFADIPAFEDLDFVNRLRRHGRFVFLPLAVRTAARRFDEYGRLRQQLRNLLLWGGYHLGLSPTALGRFYPYPDSDTPSDGHA